MLVFFNNMLQFCDGSMIHCMVVRDLLKNTARGRNCTTDWQNCVVTLSDGRVLIVCVCFLC